MNGRHVIACAATITLTTCCAACASPHPRPGPGKPDGVTATACRPAAAGTRGPGANLPFSPARLQAATVLAARFAAAYDTWSWRQLPAAWLAGLRPMTTSGLYAALIQAATVPGVLAQREATRQAARGTAVAAQIRDLTPGSVTVIVTVRQVITSTSGTTRTAVSFAVTLIPRGGGWVVYDVEPASAGNT
jgi:hypothetical protein